MSLRGLVWKSHPTNPLISFKYDRNFRPVYSHPSHLSHTSSEQLACGNRWPQPPLKQVWRWSDARWVARVAPVDCRPVCPRQEPMGREPAARKRRRRMAARQLMYCEDVAAMRRFPHFQKARLRKQGVAMMEHVRGKRRRLASVTHPRARDTCPLARRTR